MKTFTLAIIPARGGSKSIDHKNIVPFAGRLLIEHVIESAKRSREIDRIVCSTDDEMIADVVRSHNIEVMWRPAALGTDNIHVIEVIKDIIRRIDGRPDILPLLQPTSPFLLPSHTDTCIQKLKMDMRADSAQTVATLPHNYHALNQRIVENGLVKFCFPEERQRCYNKQKKPKHYKFGNVVVTRAGTVMEKDSIFGERSIAVEIPEPYAFDLDDKEDIALGEFLLSSDRVTLPWYDTQD
jgi:CMP-N,N'-diacetyllegionaminic acid synthase